jgi:ketosteroid isomerase-like protein
MGHEAANVAALREAYARWRDTKGGSVEHWLGLLSDDIKAGSLAAGSLDALPFLTSHNRRSDFRLYFAAILHDWEMLDFTVGEFVAQGDAVVMRGTMAWRHRRSGKTFTSAKVDFWRFRNGKAIEFFECFDTAGALSAAQ